jgi:pyrimidine oxygenase
VLDGVDEAAVATIFGLASIEADSEGTARQLREAVTAPVEDGNMAFFSVPVIWGSDETIARRLDEIQAETGLSGIMLTFIDWMDDLRWFGERIRPLLS